MNRPIIFIKSVQRTNIYFNGLSKLNRHNIYLFNINSKCYSSRPNGLFYLNTKRFVSSFNHINCSCQFSTRPSYFQEKRRPTLVRSSIVSVSLQKRNFSAQEYFNSAVITHTAFFKWLSGSVVVQNAQNFIVHIHDSSGLPWWLSIILTTCLVRLVLIVPGAVYQQYVIARLENVRMEMSNLVNDIKYELDREIRKNRWSEKVAERHYNMSVRKEYKRLIERDNCHPAKASVLALVQIPLWITFSTAFRNLVYMLPYSDAAAQLVHLQMSVGGVAWFPNLTVADSFIIPIMLGCTNLAIIELQTMIYKGPRSRFNRYITNFFRGFSIFIIPVSATVPSCLALYWLTSSMFGLCQNLTMLSPRVRRLCGIPITPTTHSHPYTHIANQIKSKFVKNV